MLKILRQNAFFGMQPVECCDRVALLLTNPLCANYVQIKNPTILKLFLTTNRTKNLSKLQLPSTNHLCIPKITYILSFSYSSKVFCILGAFIFIYLIFGRRGTLHNVQNGGGGLDMSEVFIKKKIYKQQIHNFAPCLRKISFDTQKK